MGTDILPGNVLVDGTLVHDADFNTLVGDATILPTAISAKTLKPDMSLGDEFLINDAGTLKKVTGQQIVQVAVLPAGCMMDYAGTTEPLGWVFCYGQLLSRTTYAALFAAIGTAYGAGDGSTTFALPDFRGRVTAGKDDMGGTAANRITSAVSGFDATVLGNQGGLQSHTLVAGEVTMPAHTHSVPAHTHPGVDHTHGVPNHQHLLDGPVPEYAPTDRGGSGTFGLNAAGRWTNPGTGACQTGAADRSLTSGASSVLTSGSATTTGAAHRNLQPTIIVNKIIKT